MLKSMRIELETSSNGLKVSSKAVSSKDYADLVVFVSDLLLQHQLPISEVSEFHFSQLLVV